MRSVQGRHGDAHRAACAMCQVAPGAQHHEVAVKNGRVGRQVGLRDSANQFLW